MTSQATISAPRSILRQASGTVAHSGIVTHRAIEFAVLVIAALFLILHALHLDADFPNNSPWMDWSKYTDEGWYGDAAIRHFQRGHWYIPGDFNPAAALPVWPLLEAAVFHFTGVNLVCARALTVVVFALILGCSWLLLRYWQNVSMSADAKRNSLAPAIAVLLLAVSPFCYAFTRMAILEPMLILLTLLALLVASFSRSDQERASLSRGRRLLRALPLVCLGLILPLMVLTKTTAVFLFPAVAWILWARADFEIRPFLRLAIPPALIGAVIWLGYFSLVVRPHFLTDYRYLFSANAYTGITVSNAISVIRETFTNGLWMGHLLYPSALFAIGVVLLLNRRLLRNPLVTALLLWAFGYLAFLAYHANLQPRYYLVVAIPITLLVPIVFESIWNRRNMVSPLHHLAAGAAISVLILLIFTDARQTLQYVRTPEYTFTRAASQIRDIIAADRTHNPLVLSISGSDLSLMTGLPSICDDFGTMDLADRVRAYQPGWYATWNQVDDDKMDALAPMYQLRRVASFPALDDPERNLLILYRLDPASPSSPRRPHRRRPIPRLLQTNLGQQPSPTQLVH